MTKLYKHGKPENCSEINVVQFSDVFWKKMEKRENLQRLQRRNSSSQSVERIADIDSVALMNIPF
jgi:hypothetical protein